MTFLRVQILIVLEKKTTILTQNYDCSSQKQNPPTNNCPTNITTFTA